MVLQQTVLSIVKALRPVHWIKNAMVLAPVFFAHKSGNAEAVLLSLLAFGVFCAASSAAYLFNDLCDAPDDGNDPRKRLRPLASGRIKPETQRLALVAVMAAAIIGCAALPAGVGGMVIAYWVAMTLYSLLLKRFWLIGAAIISLGMIARVFAGAAAIDVNVSKWVLPCAFFLTAFVVTGKRIYDANGAPRPRLLMPVFYLCGAATFFFYLFYSLTDVTMLKYHTRWIFLTSLPVLSGLYGYLRVVKSDGSKREHLEAVVLNPLIAASLAAWLIGFFMIIYF